MPTTTTRLKLPRPLGTDNFNLANQQALIDAIETNAAQRDDYTVLAPYAAVTGVANTYVATLTPAPTAYVDGMAVTIKINVTNTAVSTLNVNGLGAKSIRKPDGSDVTAGELVAGSVYTLRYNGMAFIIQGSAPTIDYMKQGVNGTTSGSANAYTLTPSPVLSSYQDFLRITVVFHVANTGAATINISGLGVRGLKKSDGTDFASGELKTGTPYTFVLVGSNFIAQGEGGTVQRPAIFKDNWIAFNNLYANIGCGVAAIGTKIYVTGGKTSGASAATLKTMSEYDVSSDTWTLKADMIGGGLHSAGVTAVDGKIFVIGGRNDASSWVNYHYQFDPLTNTWTSRANMLTGRESLSCCTVGSKVYAIGGSTAGGLASNKNEEYDNSLNTWTTRANMTIARSQHASAVIGTKIYVTGGTVSGGNPTSSVEVYDTATNTWSSGSSLPISVNLHICVALEGELYVSAGGISGSANAEVYVLNNGTWVKKKNLPSDGYRYTAAAAAVMGAVFIFGGYDPGGNTTSKAYAYIK